MKGRRILSLALFLSFMLTGCAREQELPAQERSLFAMNTYMTFTAYGKNAAEALDMALEQVEEAEALWSVTDQNSEIYQANHSGGQPVTVSDETAQLVSFALDMAEQTDGAVDPTIYPVLSAWGFTTQSKQVPEEGQIASLLQNVDYGRISLEGDRLTVPDGMQLDMGAVGKGYAGDLVIEVLKEYGVESALINLGGNVQAISSRPDGNDWRLGIRAPWEEGNLGVLRISDAAVVTSGGYENYFEDEEGNIYWHILDPSTGYPADGGLQAVTIIGEEGKLCDALSTALFVMGEDGAVKYWRANGGFDMLLVTEDGEIILTEGIAGQFTLNENRTEQIRVIER